MPEKSKIETIRHSLAHILAAAIQELYPKTKFGIGPAVENGFYYDFDLPKSLTSKDLPKIEQKMKEIIKKNQSFEKKKIKVSEAIKLFKKLNQPYKIELIEDVKKKTNPSERKKLQVTKYKVQNFIDLCQGPHIKLSKEIPADAFKLERISGAYWKGDEKNQMLTRIYGLAFETKKELKDYIKLSEEAEKRNHRKLGKTLDLFVFSDLVGPGLPLFTPKGVIIIDALKKYIEKVCGNYGFKKVLTPHLAKISLYEHSGHAKKFSEELFRASSQRNHEFTLRPVLCPHQTQIYASKPRSYRDLPIRYMETEKMYRAEKSGEVGGLNRVYAITVEDGHTFCRLDQVKDEIKNLVNIIKDFYSALGMWSKHWVSLSVRDYKQPEKYIGEPKDWKKCEKILKEVSDEMGLNAKRREGEAALYGPKLDFMFKDALGKEIQIPTVQLDFATPKRFNLVYTNEKGQEVNPVMVHRAILGSYERFLVLLLEHFAGAFPVWLSPVQAVIIPISEKLATRSSLDNYGNKVLQKLKENNVRAEIDNSNETLGKRIRQAELQKIPYILIVGKKEIKSNTITVRSRKKEQSVVRLEKFLEQIKNEI